MKNNLVIPIKIFNAYIYWHRDSTSKIQSTDIFTQVWYMYTILTAALFIKGKDKKKPTYQPKMECIVYSIQWILCNQ